MKIGEYEPASPFVTAGSGNARWCVAARDDKRYFLKQFLSPVQPVQTAETPDAAFLKRRMRCASFERRKRALYDALNRMRGDYVVRADDFFVFDGHYYTASEYLGSSYQTFETFRPAQLQTKLKLLRSLAECLRALHACGVVHADLKPEHVVVENHGDGLRIRLIDFDSGFMESSPPDAQSGMEIDPVYLSPEAFLLISGKAVRLSRRLDTFALGILMHQSLAGDLPGFDKAKYAYLHAAVLDGGRVFLSDDLSRPMRKLIRRMIRKYPAFRPGDGAILKALRDMQTQAETIL